MFCLSSQSHTSLNEVHVDFAAQVHAVLELVLIVALRSLRLDVLLDRIDLRLVLNQFLLDIVQPVVNLVLQDLVFHFVVIHRLVSDLLGQAILVHLQKLFDLAHA